MPNTHDHTNPPALSCCPRCASRRLVSGTIPTVEGNRPAFHPKAQRFGVLRAGVGVSKEWHACIECGFIFGNVSPSELHDQLALFAKPEMIRWLTERPDTGI
jgi:hypothetical protein